VKIGVLGSGDVGRVLGAGFAGLGHSVKLGTRDPRKPEVQAWVRATGKGASAGTFAEAAKSGEVLVLAVAGSAVEEVARLAGPESCAGKPVIDATNPLDFSQMPPRLSVGHTDSLGERVQRLLPAAHVVKAFNTVGNPHMVRPDFPGGPPDMFICGNDEGAKAGVTDLTKALGWNVIDLGGIEVSRYLEPLAMVWITHFFRTNSGNHAFKLLRK
jgi:8-hydroxy-5-deazaflavin:NADPH oxidoreductase